MADWVIVVDDDTSNLKIAGQILSRANMRVTALKSGKALLSYVEENGYPDLLLLDIKMPEMDGFETLQGFRRNEPEGIETPVIFLTADDNEATETRGLSLGAMDFIKKPFVPDVLTIRVRHIIDLSHLQKNLENEVRKKTEDNERLMMHVVRSLADAIDAKDTYTNGHSGRVAKYSKEIARRLGYTEKKLQEIYMMGLLHDVGKIGVPDAVINKPSKLSPEEFELIKKHPVMGARILENIIEMPSLVTGARWHH
ncbi:MAG: response regulator, partial [Lachnospiraceae bacterium]|nr:response regulator [Lachnospiraceae bacterium]